MSRLLATLWKETLILARDRAGLVVIFGMPTALVLIATLVQEGTMRMVRAPTLNLLMVDADRDEVSSELRKGLDAAGVFRIVEDLDGTPPTAESARAAVAKGRFQGAIILDSDATKRARERADLLVGRLLEESTTMPSLPSPADATVTVLVDPVLPEAWRKLLRSGTTGVLLGLETRMVMARAGREFARRAMDRVRAEVPGAAALVDRIGLPEVRMPERPGMIIGMEEIVASKDAWVLVPTSVQQNVPAWTIFAMFLIIIPLAGCMIRERQEGTMHRLLMVPGAFLAILLGKAVLYVGVCLIQFGMMFAIGVWVLPALGTPALQAGNHPEAVFVVGLATSLAAVGFGMAVGSIARTPEQASMFGATLVVIAGALGGIMFPVFSMPGFMQKLALASPLGWAQSAFLDLFLRSGNVVTVLPQVLGLLAFAAAGTGIALTFYYRRG